jgi:hypothetical protein
MNSSIPTSIRIGKTSYKVECLDRMPSAIVVGRISYGTCTIKIAERSGSPLRRRSDRAKLTTFWHEAVHGILYDMGSRKESDEAFVDGIAKRIVQVLSSAKFADGSQS